MQRIETRYKKLVEKFHKIETKTTNNKIHDKRVILRRIFPILGFFNVQGAKFGAGKKAFALFGKLRDIQVQILKLEKMEQPQELMEYLDFLKVQEIKHIKRVTRFTNKKQLKFPSLKNNKKKNPCQSKALFRQSREKNAISPTGKNRSDSSNQNLLQKIPLYG
jgi:CHAD domain-containing protein